MPNIPLRTIMSTDSKVSRASVGFSTPVSMTAEIMITSMLITETVRISVP